MMKDRLEELFDGLDKQFQKETGEHFSDYPWTFASYSFKAGYAQGAEDKRYEMQKIINALEEQLSGEEV